ncbi:MAG: acetyltransferase [Christiangramia sp.]|nr:acetyltransferase [Christiangramia sp.]
MEKILLIGASDHCKYTIDIIEQSGKYQIAGILDRKLNKGSTFEGYPVLGYLEYLSEAQVSGIKAGIVAIGDNFTRWKVVDEILQMHPDFQFCKAIHPSVIVGKNTVIGSGCVIMAGVILNNDCYIGDHCFIATKASLDHDSRLGSFSSLSPGVTTGGRVYIGERTAIGIGANILHYIEIGSNVVIGGGSLVNKKIEDDVLSYGVPAKPVRKRTANEKYL